MLDVSAFLDSISSPRLPRRVRGFLNIIFVAGITSFCFELAYFEYRLIDLLSFEEVYRFLIDGHFFLPFAIFYCIWWSTDLLANPLFERPNDSLSQKVKPYFMNVFKRAWRSASATRVDGTNESWAPESRPTSKSSLRKELSEKKQIKDEFILLVRGLVASIVYFIQIPYFSTIMFVFLLIVIFSSAILLFAKYQMFDILRELELFIRQETEAKMPPKIITP